MQDFTVHKSGTQSAVLYGRLRVRVCDFVCAGLWRRRIAKFFK
jgi:hypothetical protein